MRRKMRKGRTPRGYTTGDIIRRIYTDSGVLQTSR